MSTLPELTISNDLCDFVDRLVAEGRYASTEEVVAAGLHLLDLKEQKLRALNEALQEGLDSGVPRPFDFEDLFRKPAADERRSA